MITLEALVMVALAAVAVYIAYTKLSCNPDDARITWLPEMSEGAPQEGRYEGNTAHLQS